ncbi:MAG: VCBS repeat-containing protein, partial [Acidobacteria bacterium]|nr:VCBS repeat-containing protein [Acidobacteriota bacterium]
MKNDRRNSRLIRLAAAFFLTPALAAGALFAWQTRAAMQGFDRTETTEPIVVRQTDGKPFVNFGDGVELASPPNAAGEQSPQTLVAADFDSDGVPDLVTADATGSLRFYKGSGRSANGENRPFEAPAVRATIGFSPDFLAAGDFNADGRPDILAAAKGTSFLEVMSGDGR